MIAEPVDERDSSWEDPHPRYRVYLFEGGDRPGHSWSTETYDVRGADVLEVVRWGEAQAGPDRLCAVALVVQRDEGADPVAAGRGLVWLLGIDANGQHDETDARGLARMLARREARR